MAALPKPGDKFLYDGLILEAQASGCTCSRCFFMIVEDCICTLTLKEGILPRCSDPDHDKDIIYKYLRPATDEEISTGKVSA